jgi:protein-S-isoprenylcysteine O-methyltransferase Ste14
VTEQAGTPGERTLRRRSIAGFLLMVIAVEGLLVHGALLARSPATIALQGLAVGLFLWARVTFGRRGFHAPANPTAGGVVTGGPYRWIRHPIYSAICLFAWAAISSRPSALGVALGILLVGGALLRIVCEERLIAERYPEYRRYAAQTHRMVPYLF